MAIKLFLLRLMACKPPAMELGPEDRLAIEIATACRAWTLEERLHGVWWHTPNEGGGKHTRKAQIELGLKRALGLIRGAPDLVFIGPARLVDHTSVVVLIELKAGKNGQSENQKDFESWAASNQITYCIARSLAQVEAILTEHGLLLPRRAS